MQWYVMSVTAWDCVQYCMYCCKMGCTGTLSVAFQSYKRSKKVITLPHSLMQLHLVWFLKYNFHEVLAFSKLWIILNQNVILVCTYFSLGNSYLEKCMKKIILFYIVSGSSELRQLIEQLTKQLIKQLIEQLIQNLISTFNPIGMFLLTMCVNPGSLLYVHLCNFSLWSFS